MLHVPDQDVMPVDPYNDPSGANSRSTGRKLGDPRLPADRRDDGFIAYAIILQRMFFCTKKSYGIIDQQIALHLIRKVAAGY